MKRPLVMIKVPENFSEMSTQEVKEWAKVVYQLFLEQRNLRNTDNEGKD